MSFEPPQQESPRGLGRSALRLRAIVRKLAGNRTYVVGGAALLGGTVICVAADVGVANGPSWKTVDCGIGYGCLSALGAGSLPNGLGIGLGGLLCLVGFGLLLTKRRGTLGIVALGSLILAVWWTAAFWFAPIGQILLIAPAALLVGTIGGGTSWRRNRDPLGAIGCLFAGLLLALGIVSALLPFIICLTGGCFFGAF